MFNKQEPVMFSDIDLERFKKAEDAVDRIVALGLLSEEDAISILCALASGEKASLVIEVFGAEIELQLEI